MLRGGPARRGSSPDRGEGGGELWTPGSCYLDGDLMKAVLNSLDLLVHVRASGCFVK